MSGPDESSGMSRAMEGLKIINEVECKMCCSSSKVINYILPCESVLSTFFFWFIQCENELMRVSKLLLGQV